MQNTHLIEPGARYFFKKTLEGCHKLKNKYYNTIYNLGYFIIFILLLIIILYFKKKNKPSLEEKEKKKRIQYEYIISKLRNFQDIRQHASPNTNFDLPIWENNPDVQFYNRKIYK